MVDVGSKPVSLRRAVAEGEVRMRPATLTLITQEGRRAGGGACGCDPGGEEDR